VHEKASRFLGDIFVYLSERGTLEAPGAIVTDVLADLEKADKAKRSGDDKLIVIGHSLGGVIIYDILTYFRPDLKFDVLASVGSQIALFEEMSLYRASKADVPPNPPKDLLPQPTGIAKWLNVFDTNDVFSFRAQGVFAGPTDYRFDTGYGLLQAHGGYFARPSFYKRLAARLSQS
jgi:pimeloyl-ACP methyl ester carboxylesterase